MTDAELDLVDTDRLCEALARRGQATFVVIIGYPDTVAVGKDFRVWAKGSCEYARFRSCVNSALEISIEDSTGEPPP